MDLATNLILDSCDSTNTLAKQLGEKGALHGAWISARKQKAGRGRQGREWVSEEGNLFLSIIVRPRKKSNWTWIPLVTAIAVCEAIESKWPELEVRAKWPNDLWIEGRKLGGILCEGVGSGDQDSFVVIGIGLNCLSSPTGLDQETISLSEALGQKITADQVREFVIEAVLKWMKNLETFSSEKLIQSYERYSALKSGSEIQWQGGSGIVTGLSLSGELNVINDHGLQQKLVTEEIRAVRIA